MPEKYRLLDQKDFTTWAIMEMLGEAMNQKLEIPITPGEGVEIELKINGVEVSLDWVIKRLEVSLDELIEEKAVERLKDKGRNLHFRLEQLAESIWVATKAKALEFGLDIKDEDDDS